MQLFVKHFDGLTPHELYAMLRLRSDVFVVEQQCIYLDIDDRDQQCLHVWLADERGVAGYLRVLPAGLQGEHIAIGRVVTRDRGQGLGKRLMQAGIDTAVQQLGAEEIRIEAQCYAQGFYEKLGFVQISEPFLEDGIPHIHMTWRRADA